MKSDNGIVQYKKNQYKNIKRNTFKFMAARETYKIVRRNTKYKIQEIQNVKNGIVSIN